MTPASLHPQPPRLARALLAAVLPAADRDAVCRDVGELFALRAGREGLDAAQRWYRRQVLAFAVGVTADRLRRLRRHPIPPFRQRGDGLMRKFFYDMRQSLGRLRRAPVFTLISVLTLGVGVGVFTSVFALIDAVLIEPMPYRAPSQLHWVWRDYTWASFPRGWLGGSDVIGLREQADVFEGAVAFQTGRLNMTIGESEQANQVTIVFASHELFDLLGVPVSIGRGFQAADDFADANQVVVLGHDAWRAQFGADPNVVGRSILIDGQTATIVGVAPRDLHFVQQASLAEPISPDIYSNLSIDLRATSPGSGSFAGLVRVRDGVTPDQLEAALARAAKTSDDFFRNRGLRLWTENMKGALTSSVRPALTAIIASAGFLLLVLSVNLATLLLGRAAVRQRELGIRAALGADQRRLASAMFSESLVLGVLGGAIGVALAFVGTGVIVRIAPDNLARLDEVAMSGRAIVVGIVLSILAILMASATPTVGALRANLVRSLKEGGRGGESLGGARLRGALVASQVALSILLLVGAGLVAEAFTRLVRADPGFDPSGAITFRVSLATSSYPDPESILGFDARLRERLEGLPAVTDVGGANTLPLTTSTNQTSVTFPGAPGNTGDSDEDGPLIDRFAVTTGYMEAAGFRLLSGRAFGAGDGDRPVVIIDDVLARRFFPGGEAVGALLVANDTNTIVGVVDQARLYTVHADDRGQVYFPFGRVPMRRMSYAVRATTDPETLIGAVRQIVRDVEPSAAISDIRTLDSFVHTSLGKQRLSLTLLAAFAGGALLLATLGIYGVVSNNVVRRTREIGVRVALGADRTKVIRMVVGHGLRLAILGAAVGVVGAIATGGLLRNVMFGVKAQNPAIYVAVTVGIVTVAALASYVPALGATRISPMTALRSE